MSSVQHLREFISERLTAAAEEIFTEFEKTIVRYEEEMDRQRRLLDITRRSQRKFIRTTTVKKTIVRYKEEVLRQRRPMVLTQKPRMEFIRTVLPQEVCRGQEIFVDQELDNQDRTFNLDLWDAEILQMKRKQQECSISQEGQQLVQRKETETLMVTSTHEEMDHSELRQNDLPQGQVGSRQEIFVDQELDNQDRTFNLDLWDAEILQQECSISQEGQHLVQRKETEALMVTSTHEEMDRSEPRQNDFPKEQVCRGQEIFVDQELDNQDRTFNLDLWDAEILQMNRKQQECSISQEGQQLVQRKEAETLMVTSTHEEMDHHEARQNVLPQEVCRGQEIFVDQELDNQDRTFNLDLWDAEILQMKRKQQECSISQEGQQLVQRKETETLMVTSTHEEMDHSELRQNDLPQGQVGSRQEIFVDQELDNQDRTFNLDLWDAEILQQECSISQEGQHLVQRKETEALMVTSTHEEMDRSEPRQNDFPKEQVCRGQEIFVDQELDNQDRTFNLDLWDAEILQMNRKQQECSISQEGQQLVQRKEAETLMVTSTHEEMDHHEARQNDFPKDQVCRGQEIFVDQELDYQDRTFNLDLWDAEILQMNRKQQECSISQEGQQLVQRKGTETLMVTSTHEEMDRSEPRQNDLQQEQVGRGQVVFVAQELNSQDRTFNLDLWDAEILQMKRKQQECSISQEGQQLVQRKETETLMVTSTHEEMGHSELRQNGDQLVYTSFHLADNQCNTDGGHKFVRFDVCAKVFKDESCMKRHRKRHIGQKSYLCQTCGKSFGYSCALTRHMRIHTDEKQHSCKTCGKCFIHRDGLNVHNRTHTQEKPFSCKTCGKSFTQSGHLKAHIRSHTGEKPYCCDICGKCYKRSDTLWVHKRTHTDQKPYLCNACGKRFNTSSALTQHTAIHTSEKQFFCKTCGKSFSQRSNLTVHMKTHTGEKPFSCETCGESFRQAGTLSRHMGTHRGKRL